MYLYMFNPLFHECLLGNLECIPVLLYYLKLDKICMLPKLMAEDS